MERSGAKKMRGLRINGSCPGRAAKHNMTPVCSAEIRGDGDRGIAGAFSLRIRNLAKDRLRKNDRLHELKVHMLSKKGVGCSDASCPGSMPDISGERPGGKAA